MVRATTSVLPYLMANSCKPLQNDNTLAIASDPDCITPLTTVVVAAGTVAGGTAGAVAGAVGAAGVDTAIGIGAMIGVGVAAVVRASSRAVFTNSANDMPRLKLEI